MKKLSILVLIAVLSGAASASQVANPVLKYTRTNGSVAPQHRFTTTCSIYPDYVYILTVGTMVTPSPINRKVAWTAAVPNASRALDLIRAARKGSLRQKIGRIGAASETYEGILTIGAGAPDPVLLESYSQHNESAEARTLTQFLDFNCKAQ